MRKKARLKHYAAGLSAVSSIVPSSQASVVYWNPSDVTMAVGQGASFDILTGVVSTTGPAEPTAIRVHNSGFEFVYFAAAVGLGTRAVGGSHMSLLTVGDTIGPAQSFSGDGIGYFDSYNRSEFPWNTGVDGTTGFVGLKFTDGSGLHYGWAQFTYNDISNTLVLQDFAYETNPNTVILAGAGAVPEPSSLLLLASGGVLAARRRRAA